MSAARDDTPTRLYYESGGSWFWVLAGPLMAGSMLWMDKGHRSELVMPMTLMVFVSGFVAILVKAGRIHKSVELTRETLRQGKETIRVAEIVRIYPEAGDPLAAYTERARWQSARTLGELRAVPPGRVGIGLRLTGGRTAQAWARGHRHLRAALAPLVAERVTPPDRPKPDAGDDDAGSRR